MDFLIIHDDDNIIIVLHYHCIQCTKMYCHGSEGKIVWVSIIAERVNQENERLKE